MERRITVRWCSGQLSTPSKEWSVSQHCSFEDRFMEVEPSVSQYLEDYLENYTCYLSPFGTINECYPILAFSYGEGREVNLKLAQQVVVVMTEYPGIKAILQWEIADIVLEFEPRFVERISRVELPVNKDYITTKEVATYALKLSKQRNVNIVAQLWHASRCIRQVEELGWRVASLRGADAFAANDPQCWVRHPLDWLIKESWFRYIDKYGNKEIV